MNQHHHVNLGWSNDANLYHMAALLDVLPHAARGYYACHGNKQCRNLCCDPPAAGAAAGPATVPGCGATGAR